MASWLWQCRSNLKSSDVDQSRIDALFEEAVDSCLLLILFKPAGEVPPAIEAAQRETTPYISAARLTARKRWQMAAGLVRAVVRWRTVLTGRSVVEAVATSVPRFMRAMLQRRADVGDPQQISGHEDNFYDSTGPAECLRVLLVLVLDNHQRAVARASGLRFLCVLAGALRTRSFFADALGPLVSALQTPLLVDRHILTHLCAVGRGVTFGVTATFQALLDKLGNILRESLADDIAVSTNDVATSATKESIIQGKGREGDTQRNFDCRTVLVLLQVWALTIRPEDWSFVEASDIIGTVSRVAAQCEINGRITDDRRVPSATKTFDEIIRADGMISRKLRATQAQVYGAHEQKQKCPLAICISAARALFCSLVMQLHGTARVSSSLLRAESPQLDSIFEVLYGELDECVSRARAKTRRPRHEPRRESGRGGVGAHFRDRTPSQAILEFAPPLIGGFPDSPPHVRMRATNPGSGTGSSLHKRRCQELVNSPRQLMNMEDGLVFPADHVLTNPRGSDFSITFWLFLAQDRTGHRRTVLARGQESERWPVLLLRSTDNRLEVRVALRRL